MAASGEFVLCIPSRAIANQVLAVGSQSGHEVDKFAVLGVGAIPAKVQAPLIEGCVAWLECKVIALIVVTSARPVAVPRRMTTAVQ